jgi:hypothetical protein
VLGNQPDAAQPRAVAPSLPTSRSASARTALFALRSMEAHSLEERESRALRASISQMILRHKQKSTREREFPPKIIPSGEIPGIGCDEVGIAEFSQSRLQRASTVSESG